MANLLVVVIQCDDVTKRCSGFACMNDFYERTGAFAGYPDDTRYMSMTCGGCCGNFITAKIEHLTKKLEQINFAKQDVIVHLASCICSENSHRQPCPFMNRMRNLLNRKGYEVKLGSHISKKAQARRDAGIYKSWQ